ncbi:MAG: proton-conducting transporter membrane subunit, partial [Planctomycetota bacterium]|nr:proton-conducting transporter membrane subunit [Planctomycetota bacterium]
MVSVGWILGAVGLLALSGLPACLMSFRSAAGQRASALLLAGGSLVGLAGLAVRAFESASPAWNVPWFLPWGQFAIALDPLSAVFLAPVFVVPALGALYALRYWKQSDHPDNGRRLGFFYGLLAGGMTMVLISRDAVLFLIAWEAMALAAYFALAADERNPQARRAGWVYLVATHAGTLALVAMFALWRRATGSFALTPAAAMPAAISGTIFVLALVGFGFKAGLMPLHVWLPGAHANAPSHVSAVLSGVMLKVGLYGIVRLTAILPAPAAWWGAVLLAVGAVSGVAGIVFALAQQDIKRTLAYSSIDNVGIIAMGLGLALLGRATGRTDWVLLGLGGALLHVWNHAAFKSLLFLAAGAVIHAAGTGRIDRLGGLAKRMPRTAGLFLVGAMGICALPPLNGFVSEWLLYVGLFRTLSPDGAPPMPEAAMAAVALAMIGAMALACFVKLLGAVFLGSPRSDEGGLAHDPGACMLAPMAGLAGLCVVLGVAPAAAAPLLEQAARAWAGPARVLTPAIADLVNLHAISIMGLAVLALAGGLALIGKVLARAGAPRGAGTWDCGYARPTARMQYTGTSFADMLARIFHFILWPRRRGPGLGGEFPRKTLFRTLPGDTVLDRFVAPVFTLAAR